jgi:hypothetical protein
LVGDRCCWIEINYGLFPAFGATGGLLVAIAAICAGWRGRLKRPAPQFPSLAAPARRHQRQSDQTGGSRPRRYATAICGRYACRAARYRGHPPQARS